MDVKLINPFVSSINGVMPQLGFKEVNRKGIKLTEGVIQSSGVLITLGIIGDLKGNVMYTFDMEGAKKVASTMMMGMPVAELDDMAKSALSELSNMLTANASIHLSNDDINVDISVPTLLYGQEVEASLEAKQYVEVEFDVDGICIAAYVGVELAS